MIDVGNAGGIGGGANLTSFGKSSFWRATAILSWFYSIGAVLTLYFKLRIPLIFPLGLFIVVLVFVVPPLSTWIKTSPYFAPVNFLLAPTAGMMLGITTVTWLGPGFGYVACF
jgi:hypothetical protein